MYGFSNITSFTQRQLNILASKFKQENSSPKELRGGLRTRHIRILSVFILLFIMF